MKTFSDYLRDADKFTVRVSKKPDGYLSFTLESEGGEPVEFEAYGRVVLRLK